MNDKHRLTIGLLQLCDLFLIAVAFVLAAVFLVEAKHDISLALFFAMRTRIVNFVIFIAALILCHIVFRLCGLYRSRRLSRRRTEIVDVLEAMTLSSVCFAILGVIFHIRVITVPFLVLFWALGTCIVATARLALRLFAAQLRARGKDLRYMLIVGSNQRAVEFAMSIASHPERGYRLLGFVDDPWPGLDAIRPTGLRLVSSYSGLAEYLRRNVVDEVAFYLPFASFYKRSSEVAMLCQEHGIIMRFNSDLFGLKTSRWRSEEFGGNQYIATCTGLGDPVPQILKRGIDIVFAALALFISSPILLTTAIAIKLTSPGPIFFLQERIGLNKRRFKIFKFRTMVPNAERLISKLEAQNEAAGPVFKIKNDPRITPIGKFLRKTSIDELPQLLNVLRGDMSLVGPRPLPVRDYEGFNEDWQRRRFSVKPGITCLWQVNGRSGITFEQWMRLDLKYMDEWSLWLDLKILAKTVPAVLRGSGAV
ncbi:MAG: sugar transferase [Acidobacteriaceae bacterium]|nr:sugar transferase [Acidobacteriaceae bacterium]